MSLDAKADRYLTEGRIEVLSLDKSTPMANIYVHGSADKPYVVRYLPARGWDCDCPAQRTCAHILACQKITRFKPTRAVRFDNPDDDLTQFLNQSRR